MASWTRVGATSARSRTGCGGRSPARSPPVWPGRAPRSWRRSWSARGRRRASSHEPHRALWWACGGHRRARRRGGGRPAAPATTSRSGTARSPTRSVRDGDLPPRPRARRALPRPGRRGRADLPRVERRRARRARSSTRSGTRSATSSRSSASRRCSFVDRLAARARRPRAAAAGQHRLRPLLAALRRADEGRTRSSSAS